MYAFMSHLPKRGWHGEAAEHEIRDGQGDDEDVSGRAHVLPAQDGPDDQQVAAEPHDDEGGVDQQQDPEEASGGRVDVDALEFAHQVLQVLGGLFFFKGGQKENIKRGETFCAGTYILHGVGHIYLSLPLSSSHKWTVLYCTAHCFANVQ